MAQGNISSKSNIEIATIYKQMKSTSKEVATFH
jgi:hypothetical protein